MSMTAFGLNAVLLRIFNNASIDSFILQGHGSPLCQSQGSIKESRLNALALKRQSERDSFQETLHSESQPKPEDQFVWNQSEDHHYQVLEVDVPKKCTRIHTESNEGTIRSVNTEESEVRVSCEFARKR